MKKQDIESLVTSNEFDDIFGKEFNELINLVLRKIPDSYAERFPQFCIMEDNYPNVHGSIACVEGRDLDSGEWYVNFTVELLTKEPRDVQIGIIAHELAHVYLRHETHEGKKGEKPKDHSKAEKDADELACQWGFKKEIKAVCENRKMKH